MMTISDSDSDSDIDAVRRLLAGHQSDPFLEERRMRNVDGPAPPFSRELFWQVLVGCLLTTQQRSTKGSAVDRFTDTRPYPLSWEACSESAVEAMTVQVLTNFGGIRRTKTIGKQVKENREWLNSGGWRQVEDAYARLSAQRSRPPASTDKVEERRASQLVAANLAGIGPKQSRNLWQWLGLTRYEIPLDSRIVKWVNANLSRKIEREELNDSRSYDSALNYLQDVCAAAGVLPCMFDAAAFDYSDSGGESRKASTTACGFVNRNGQVTIRNTGLPGTDHMQYVYQIACAHCGHVYGANGSDIHERRCPGCQNGAPGLPLVKEAHA